MKPGSSRTGMDGAAAELVGVVKRYGKVTALGGETPRKTDGSAGSGGFELRLGQGQLTALLGPNGAGKTTAVKLMLGLARPSAGQVRVLGGDPQEAAVRQRRGAMLQVGKVPETLTVREHVELFAAYYPRPLAVADALSRAGLERLAGRRFGELSGGERQRTLFALALVGDPELLFLDEPTVGMDVEARRSLWAQIRRLVDEGRSVVLTTHYLEEADALADRVVVMHQGLVVADGPPQAIKRQVGVRQVRCRTRLPVAELSAWPGVRSATAGSDGCELLVDDAEGVVRRLLAADPALADLEVRVAALEDAFLAIVARPAA